jgi:hypothetical protein
MDFRSGLVTVNAVLAIFASMTVVNAAEGDRVIVELRSFKFDVPQQQAELFGYNDGDDKLFFYAGGKGEAAVKLPMDGEYELVVRASGDSALNERPKFKVALDGKPVGMETLLTTDNEADYKLLLMAKAGEHKLSIEFTNDAYKENEYDRNFYVHRVTLVRAK